MFLGLNKTNLDTVKIDFIYILTNLFQPSIILYNFFSNWANFHHPNSLKPDNCLKYTKGLTNFVPYI